MRVFAFMLSFNTVKMVRESMENFDATTTDAEHRHIIKTVVNPGFPGADYSELQALCVRHGWWGPVDIQNKGVVENHNFCVHELAKMRQGDYYVTWDPDVRMQEPGWITAMVQALESDPRYVFCCAAREFHHEEWVAAQHRRHMKTLPGGVRVATYECLLAWSMGMYKGEWLASRPRNFAAENPVYGYAEHCEYDRMVAAGRTWCSTFDFHDHHKGSDATYTAWKAEAAAKKTSLRYEDWLSRS